MYLFTSRPRNYSDVAFNDPPTNCRDLRNIGYTLNGFYPVQLNLVGEPKFGKIGMIYCNFKPGSKKSTPSSDIGNIYIYIYIYLIYLYIHILLI